MVTKIGISIADDVFTQIETLRGEKLSRSEFCEMLIRRGLEILKQEKELGEKADGLP